MAKLSALKVKKVGPGRHSDGGGLMLVVKESGTRSWIVRVQRHGRRRDIGIGAFPQISLAVARQRAAETRAAVRARGDTARPRALAHGRL